MATIVGIGALAAAMLASSAACKGGGGTGNPLDPDREGGVPPTPPGQPPDGGVTDTGPACDGVPIVEDGVLDLDVPAERWVRVSGSVTLSGAPIPFDVLSTGNLAFLNENGSATLVPIDRGSYAVLLRSGRYDVRFVPDDLSCFDADRAGMPCSGGFLREGLALESDGVLDLDVPVVRVQGTVTLDSAPFPSAELGTLVFAPSGTRAVLAAAQVSIGIGGSYVARLFAGEHDVALGDGVYCDGRTAPTLPCGGGPLRDDVALTSGGVLDLDIATARVEGSVTLRGLPMPSLDGSPGALAFVRADGTSVVVPLPSDAPSSYRATLLAGTYGVRFVPDFYLCASDEPPPVPCNGGPLREGVALASPGGVLDLDVPAVGVRGRVTVNGAPFDPLSSGGEIAFAPEGASADTPALAVRLRGLSDATYATTLFPGTYAIRWHGDTTSCALDTPPALPCHAGTLRSDVALASDGVLDVDVPAVVVRGQVTVDGTPMADGHGERGSVAFVARGADGSASPLAFHALGAFGPASYAVTLLAGTWIPAWVAGAICHEDPRQSVPCVGGPLSDPVTFSAPGGVLDLDVPTVEVRGRVTMGGAELPPASAERGALRFERVGGDAIETPAFAASGPADYAVTVIPGSYVVRWTPSAWLCPPTEVAPQVPCEPQPILGCPHR
ncbi:MAG: hypothetical protein IT379_20450 [Deltaproteobacteria bacterium]|nr:hypothetical protein [Deltaproteobacteria bacterium]